MDSFDSDSYFQSSEKKKLLLCALNSQQNIVETIKNTPRNDQDLAKKKQMISYLSFWVHSFPFHPYSKHDISWKYGLLYIFGGLPPNGWRSWPAAGTATGNNDIADREVEALPTDSVLYISRSHIPYWNSQLPVRSPFFTLSFASTELLAWDWCPTYLTSKRVRCKMREH